MAPVFFYLKIEVVDESFTGYRNDAVSQRLREYYQPHSDRQAMETSTIPAFSGMFVIQHGAISLFSICPFRWCLIRYCCRLTPAMAPITN